MHARVRQLRLHVRAGLGFLKHLQLFRSRTLALEGLNLLNRQLPQPELLKQRLDLVRLRRMVAQLEQLLA